MKTFLKSVNLNVKYNLDTLETPIIVYFKVTGCCNLNCSFCSQSDSKRINMDFEEAKKLLREFKKMGVISINYTGGEPLTYPYILELLKYGYSLGFEQTLITNGIDLFKNEAILNYVNTVGISLHGNPEIHDKLCGVPGVFKVLKDNIDKIILKYPQINLNINCTLTKDNIDFDNLAFIVKFAKKRNIKLSFGRLNYLGAASNDQIIDPNLYLKSIDELSKKYQYISISNCISACSCNARYRYLCHSCGAGISLFSIEPNGNVKICPSSNYVLGNAFKKNFSQISSSQYLKTYKKFDWLPNLCRLCKDFERCKGGCHAEGNFLFFDNSCDALLISILKKTWQNIKHKKLILKCGKIRREKQDFLIIKVPLRKVDKNGYKILLDCDGNKTGGELEAKFDRIENIRDFLCTLYIDGIIGEAVYEKKEN